MKPYLAGPIHGCSDAECIDWRLQALEIFPDAIDPMVRDYRGNEPGHWKKIVEDDKADIMECDALFVNYSKPSVGTAMEVLFAYENNIPVVVWSERQIVISPWMYYHATYIVDTFEKATAILKDL